MGFMSRPNRAGEDKDGSQGSNPTAKPPKHESPAPSGEKTIDDAFRFLKSVKGEFHGERHKYHNFLEIMREFRRDSISTDTVISRVMVLFDGHPDLILGFNEFLPTAYIQDAGDEAAPIVVPDD